MENEHWKLSKKGNRWRRAGRLTCTVFQRSDGSYGWCVADADGPTFSSTRWKTEKEARREVEAEVVRRDLLLESLL